MAAAGSSLLALSSSQHQQHQQQHQHVHVQATDIPAQLPSALNHFLASNGLNQSVYSAANDIRRHIRVNPRRPIGVSELEQQVF
jgi:hypothetical protein